MFEHFRSTELFAATIPNDCFCCFSNQSSVSIFTWKERVSIVRVGLVQEKAPNFSEFPRLPLKVIGRMFL